MADVERAARRRHLRSLLLNAAKERSESALTLCENEKKSSLFAPYSPSPTKMIEASWQRLRQENMIIDPTELIVDLGCGDGRWLISGAKEFQCNALGIEIDAKLVEKAIQNVQEEQMLEKIQVIQGDIMQVDISRAKLVIVYAFAQSLFSIRGHLKSQLSPEAFVLSVGFHIPGWKPKWSDRNEGLIWYFYSVGCSTE